MMRLLLPILVVALLFLPGCSGENKTVTLTTNNFEETVLKSTKPVLVDFWFATCPPCREMEPIIRELAADVEGKAVVAKLNKDDYPEIADRFDVDVYPTFLIFKDG